MFDDQTDAEEALKRDDEALAPYEAEIADAIRVAANGKDAGAVLEELLTKLPPHLRAAVVRRFRFAMEEFNQQEVRRRREQQQGQKEESKRFMFNLASAAVLMAAGTFDRIRNLMRSRPDVNEAVTRIGKDMLRQGINADMVKVDAGQTFAPTVGTRIDKGEERGR